MRDNMRVEKHIELEIRRGMTGASGFLVEGFLFLLVFVLFFLLTVILTEQIKNAEITEWLNNNMPTVSLIAAVLTTVIYDAYSDNKLGSTQTLYADFFNDKIALRWGTHQQELAYTNIREIIKVMRIDRFSIHKGRYRVKIYVYKGFGITFWTTDQEYLDEEDFQKTQLYRLYSEFQSRGVKCC